MLLEPSTHPSLLERLRHDPTDQEAWRQFVARYGPHIYGWCRHWHLQDADAEDVTQTVLTILAVRMKTFAYDPALRFRGWLRTVTRHAWSAFVESRGNAPAAAPLRQLETVEAGDDLVRRLQEQFDGELLQRAMANVQGRVAPHTWTAFRRLALQGRPAAAVAAELGLKVATVYVARSKVQRMLRSEVERLEKDEA
jgi:RNA polymerase sigma-70 factor (ECF subfamily)